MKRSRTAQAAALLLPLTLVAAACGGDDDATADATAPAVTGSPAGGGAVTTEPSTAPSNTAPSSTAPSSATPAAEFPVTIEHKYGETTIDAPPERVVSIGFGEHDGLLAIGVKPVAVRDWYGDMPYATWPWAQDELGDLQPEVIPSTELNFEQIAALQPDLILGISSGISDADYATLSGIAPTIAQPGGYVDYGTPWDVALEIAGQATGRTAEATQAIADAKAKFATVRAAHPEWQGLNAGVTYIYENQPGGYSSEDVRPRFLAELGLGTPAHYDEVAGDQFWFTVSAERLPELDTDVLIWLPGGEAEQTAIRELALRPTLTAFQEGREIVADPLLGGAFSHFSPLSFDYVIEHLVPELELALDGDPATVVPSAAVIQPGYEPSVTGDAATDASAAWSLVFDSAVPYADKSAHLEDAAALQATVESYTAAGDAMGGITLVPTDVVVDETASPVTATVTYDVRFGDSVAYSALEGRITLVDGTWVVSRDEFCSFMASARNACPA